MRNIFKTFKENKKLLEQNKILKAQNESLIQFKKSFDDYYHKISGVKIIATQQRNQVVLNSILTLDSDGMHCPIDVCKRHIVGDISQQLLPFIEFDVVDNNPYQTKDLVGKLTILTK